MCIANSEKILYNSKDIQKNVKKETKEVIR